MQPLAPADELAMVRTQIARLKAREAALSRALIAAPGAARQGRWTRAEVVDQVIRVFDHRLLPAAIRDDPTFWRERVQAEVQCHDLADPAITSALRPAQGGRRMSMQ